MKKGVKKIQNQGDIWYKMVRCQMADFKENYANFRSKNYFWN